MGENSLLDRISIDPAVCGGRPCIRGHRIARLADVRFVDLSGPAG